MLTGKTTMEAATTGVKEIAEALGGGIRGGSLVLIEGESKSGKSVFNQHLAYGALRSSGNAVAYYTIDNSAEELIAQMDSMSLDVMHDFATDRLRIYTVGSSNVFENLQKSLQLLVNHISELPARFNLVVVDSLTPLMTRINPVNKIDFLKTCKEELCVQDRSIILVVDTYVFEGKTFPRAYSMSDYYLKLRSKDVMIGEGQVDKRVIKILEVTKLCGAERQAGEGIKFEIKPKVGIQVLPFVTVKA